MNGAELKIGNFIENHTSEMVAALATLVKIPSVKGEPCDGCPFGVEPKRALDKMLEMASDMGFTVRNHENYVGTIDFYPEGEPTLGILCHLDVVPEGTGWKTPPYELTLNSGMLYGRGAMDDKGPAISVLYAMYALKKLGISLSQNVRFIVGTDEENGSADLAYYKNKEKLPERLFTPDGSYPVINAEKGMVRGEFTKPIESWGQKTICSFSGGTVINAVPELSYAKVRGFDKNEIAEIFRKIPGVEFSLEENGDIIDITCRGKSAHASQPEGGKNAVTAMIALLGMLNTDDGTSQGFGMLSSLVPYGESDGASLGIKMSDEQSGALTFVHSICEYNGHEYRGKFDIRFPVTQNVESVRARLGERLCGTDVNICAFNGVEPHCVDENSDFIKKLLSVYEHVSGKRGRCIAIGGGTYVHETEGGVAFGAEFIGDDNRMHGANERMSMDLFKMNTRMYAEAILSLCQ